jgi:hypothetical protein
MSSKKGLSEWCTYNGSIIEYYPNELGVYELVDEEKMTLYYGYGNIRTKLLEHFKKKEFPLVKYFHFQKLETEEECALMEQKLLHEYQEKFDADILPLYNEGKRQS